MQATATEPLLTPEEVAAMLAVSPATLAVWRCTRRVTGLPYMKIGRRVRYSRDAVARFLESRTHGEVEG